MTAIQEVGYEHHRQGIQPDDMEKMGEAIIVTVKELMGNEVDHNIVKAWEKLINIIAQHFNEGLTKGREESLMGTEESQTQGPLTEGPLGAPSPFSLNYWKWKNV